MDVCFFPQLGASPAEALSVEVFAELHAKGWIFGTGPGWDDKVAALMDGPGCVGFIAWRELRWRAEVSIGLGGVKPGSREFGLYRRLFTALCDHVRVECPWALTITSGYHVENASSAKMHAALGRPVVGHMTSFKLR